MNTNRFESPKLHQVKQPAAASLSPAWWVFVASAMVFIFVSIAWLLTRS